MNVAGKQTPKEQIIRAHICNIPYFLYKGYSRKGFSMTREHIESLPKDDSFYRNDEDVLKTRIANAKLSAKRKNQMRIYEEAEHSVSDEDKLCAR